MVNKLIDKYLRRYSVYHYDGWYWVINPVTRKWVINVADSGYTFFNRDFWFRFLMICPLLGSTNGIQEWVVYKLGVPKNKHCHPDYIPMDYDWRDEFEGQKIIDVMNKGVKCFSINMTPLYTKGG
jgi:hypothetical protein